MSDRVYGDHRGRYMGNARRKEVAAFYVGKERCRAEMYECGPDLVVLFRSQWRSCPVFGVRTPLSVWKGQGPTKRRERLMGWIKQAVDQVEVGRLACAAEDPTMLKCMAALHEYMTALTDGEGRPRKTSSLTLFCEDGQFKGVLSERDANLSLWASGETLNALLASLDGMLRLDRVPWRRKGQVSKPGGVKGSK